MSALIVGTSGYSYPHWKGVFYPPEVKSGRWLEYYAERFDAVELNVTYYNLPTREVFDGWRARTPDGFRFSVKGSRLITHYHRLHDVREAVGTFFEHAAGLKEKLDVVLWQLPPTMKADVERLDGFCDLTRRVSPVRQAFEFREPSWFSPDVYSVLRRHGCALCIADSPTRKVPHEITADFTYLRFHGGSELGTSEYSAGELSKWARAARPWLKEGVDVYAFFNNDAHGFAVHNAARLRDSLRGTKEAEHVVRRPVGRASESR